MEKISLLQSSSTSSFSGRKGAFVVIIKLIILFLALQLFFWFVMLPQYDDNYQAAAIDKINRLNSIDEPKIILVGDSNVAFGFRSYIIEDETGMPVVNLGMHGGLPDWFHEEMCKSNINEGDIVVLCHSRYLEGQHMSPLGASLAWITLENHFDLWRLIRKGNWSDMADAFTTYVKKSSRLFFDKPFKAIFERNDEEDGPSGYSRAAFNKYGDNVHADTYWTPPYSFASDFMAKPGQIDDAAIARINKLNEYVTAHGGRLVISHYPIAISENNPADEEAFEAYQQELIDKFDGDVISDFSDYYFDFEEFYDTDLHLGKDGAQRRSMQLATDIRKYLAEMGR